MPTYVVSTANAADPITANGDVLLLTQTGSITSSGNLAVGGGNYTGLRLVLDGSIVGSRGFEGGHGSTVTVGSTGHVTSWNIYAGAMFGNSNLTNHGTIDGLGAAIGLSFQEVSSGSGVTTNVQNFGSITSQSNTAIVINGAGSGIATIFNYGVISSNSFAYNSLFGGVDNITNVGVIWGSIFMGVGDDSFNSRDGYVYGSVFGGAGNDTLIGGRSVDSFYGGSDNDTIWFSIEDAFVDGGDGYDVARNTHNDFGLTFDMGASRIEAYYGSQAGETIVTTANVRMDVDAGGGNDLIIGGAQGDGIAGGNGDDQIFGNGGPDTLAGGHGNDRITGGEGADVLFGEAGNDTFIYNGIGDAGDQIMDFEIGRDRIEILRSGFDFSLGVGTLAANRLVAGPANQAFGQFLIDTGTGNVFWDGDGTGAGAATFLFRATGGLNHTDFVVV